MPLAEFAAMTAYMISLVALGIDSMLPALHTIGAEMGVTDPNRPQWIISAFFLGLAVGQLLYGPVSDTTGRRPTIFAGLFLFILGCILSMVSTSFTMQLAGRVLQGFGAAGPRIVSLAIVRDQYEGREMAKVSSIIMGFFVVVPALAPLLGQTITHIAGWRAVYFVLLAMAALVFVWYGTRLGETLHPEYRRKFSLGTVASGVWEVLTTKVALGYTLGAGLVFGAFVSYLMTSPQLFEDLFGITDKFPYYFGGLSIAIGSAALVNSRLVMKFGMRKLCMGAVFAQITVSVVFFILAWLQGGHLSLIEFLIWAVLAFFVLGVMFGNVNAIAMEPLGHIAGIGSAVVGSVSGIVSVTLGTLIGQQFNGTVLPLIGGFVVLGVCSFLVMRWADKHG
ncbi:MAG TPA: MFS transporter [Hellea balneolensis]|uniref:MFS transporter n=1 Tax=Hellea balneolensis TaxID=287478 RepID=A0A7C5M0X3_9PROT|nr:MFS transporter [Hellea balneolensis]